MNIFESFSLSSNRLFILGSLDYFHIVFKYEKLDGKNKQMLLEKLYGYCEKIEKEYFDNCICIEEFSY